MKVTDIIFCIGNPDITTSDYAQVNITPLQNLIDLCQEIKSPPKIIFLSDVGQEHEIRLEKLLEKIENE